jgi:hypothetical protein
MMDGKVTLQAGAAQRVITPPMGVSMAGWHFRAAGDNKTRYVHDDLYVKALAVQRGQNAWALLIADLAGVDAVAVAEIRKGIAERSGLSTEAILVCATHCHSGPVVCPVGSTANPDEFRRNVVHADGTVAKTYGEVSGGVASVAYYAGEVDWTWKAQFVAQAIEAGVEAWQTLRAAEVSFSRAAVEGVASSRRVLLSDGSWGDPRREAIPGAKVVSRTEIDPYVRVLLLREQETRAPLAAVINYSSHPWVFSGPGISAEIAGATSEKVADAWRSSKASPPVILYMTGPEGDITLIWNIDIERVWKTRPEETEEESLSRRIQGFDQELERLSGRLASAVLEAINTTKDWSSIAEVRALRRQVALPLKKGYRRPPDVLVADWQKVASESEHWTEVQALALGEGAIVGLPGEPFVSLGRAIRDRAPYQHLLIAALANDSGAISYIADQAAYEQGGYELTHTPAAAGAGEVLVEQAIDLLHTGERDFE